MGKTKATRENILVLIQLWAVTKENFTAESLAKFLGVTRREARKYIQILKERGLVEDLGNLYVLKELNEKAGRLLCELIEKIAVIQASNKATRKIDVEKVKEGLSRAYEILLGALDYCTNELGEVINYDAYDAIDDALKIIQDLMYIIS